MSKTTSANPEMAGLEMWVKVAFAVIGVLVTMVGVLLGLGYNDLKADLSKIGQEQARMRTNMRQDIKELSAEIRCVDKSLDSTNSALLRHEVLITEEILPLVRQRPAQNQTDDSVREN